MNKIIKKTTKFLKTFSLICLSALIIGCIAGCAADNVEPEASGSSLNESSSSASIEVSNNTTDENSGDNLGEWEESIHKFTNDFGQEIVTVLKVNKNVSMVRLYADGVLTQKSIYNITENKAYAEAIITGETEEVQSEAIVDSTPVETISLHISDEVFKEPLNNRGQITDLDRFKEYGDTIGYLTEEYTGEISESFKALDFDSLLSDNTEENN